MSIRLNAELRTKAKQKFSYLYLHTYQPSYPHIHTVMCVEVVDEADYGSDELRQCTVG